MQGKKQRVNTSRKGSTKEPREPACEAVVLAPHFDTVSWALHQSRELQSDAKPGKGNWGDVLLEPLASVGATWGAAQRYLLDRRAELLDVE